MDGLDHLRTFLEIAARGSFSRAAGKLGISKATVSKHVATLESRFNVRLFNRSTRSVTLTDAGRLLQLRSAPLVEMIELTQSEMQAHGSRPSGRLRVAGLHGLVQTAFPGLLSEFLTRYPDVHIDLQLGNRVVDLVEEGVDVALKFGRIGDENLIVRRLQRVALTLCATPRYWARRGMPKQPDDMRHHDVLTYSLGSGAPYLPFEVEGQPYNLPIQGRMDANDAGALIAAALAGIGAVCVPALMAQPHTDCGNLVPVLQEFMPRDMWLYAAYTQRRHNSAALRALLELLEVRMREGPQSAPA
ncbi:MULTISPECIES: LysR substrate-binding domain-containing protein [unclassified Variovorax]|jgi:DNA-binding transcriptional LysR family regulator|uniref:LysR substrate-binding domain-containing protein n=1 Tax=unclassified Variovorax TaxID=663243 RepID=UPI0008C07835|nr:MULTISPECIES: LysR family transcriptional regulator [unclassified Variovorax]SEK08138.1 DNA-binding transcriptional regulator, LysR family [Variovorax sp. OK202]SFD54547.1 DNA-binding transcriptional regulator, LysR family [Variovorax sp. OK212]